MFTGLIKGLGQVYTVSSLKEGKEVSIKWGSLISVFEIGDSISINGVCSTIIKQSKDNFTVQFLKETLSKTTFSSIVSGQSVNLEPCITPSTALGGHFVSGHIDGLAKVVLLEKNDPFAVLTIEIEASFLNYTIPKGSIAIDGISLTIADIKNNLITVYIIPHTLNQTTLGSLKKGDSVNIEFDMIGKYLYNFYKNESQSKDTFLSTLKKSGFVQ